MPALKRDYHKYYSKYDVSYSYEKGYNGFDKIFFNGDYSECILKCFDPMNKKQFEKFVSEYEKNRRRVKNEQIN